MYDFEKSYFDDFEESYHILEILPVDKKTNKKIAETFCNVAFSF